MADPRMTFRWLLLAVLFLAGCATQLPYDQQHVAQDIERRTGYENAPDSSAQGFTLPPGVAPADGLTEDEAVMTALWNNAQFQATLAELDLARADLAAAGQLPNPTLSLLFPVGPKQLDATVSQVLSFLWQRPYRVAAAKLDAERVADNLVQHGLQLVLRTRATHTDLIAAEEQAVLMQQQAAVLEEIAGAYEARLRVGDISELGVSTIRVDAMRTRGAALQARYAADTTRYHLLTLLGAGTEEFPFEPVAAPLTERAADTAFAPSLDLGALVQSALAARPDIRAAELSVEAAGKRVGLERAQIFSLIGALDANALGGQGFEAGPGLDVELPLLSQNQGGRQRARAELKRALRRYTARQHAVIQGVRDAAAAYRTATEAFTYWHAQIVPGLEQDLVRTERTVEVGEAARLTALEKRRQLLEARMQATRARAARERARAKLDYSVGTKVERDMQPSR